MYSQLYLNESSCYVIMKVYEMINNLKKFSKRSYLILYCLVWDHLQTQWWPRSWCMSVLSIHCKLRVIMIPSFSPLVAPYAVITTTYGATSGDKVGIVVIASLNYIRADSRFAPRQWETSLQSNAISHWRGANLESSLYVYSCLIIQCMLML